ncbi:MAG: ABC transporter substrate-binding protein [Nitrososphaerota archaeon]
MSEDKKPEVKISRRKAISSAAAAGAVVGVGIVAGLGGYLAGTSAGGGVQTVTQKGTVTVGGQTVTVGGQTVTVTNIQTQTVTASQLPREIKIGVVLPLSGELGPIGIKMLNGAKLAETLSNQWGGIAGSKITIVAEDSLALPDKALETVKKLVEVDGVHVIAGPATSVEVLTVADYVIQRKVPLISMSATAAAVSKVGGQYIFRVVPSDAVQTKALADLIRSQGIRRLATFVVSNDYGIGIEEGIKANLGDIVVLSIRYDPAKGDYREELGRIRDTNVEAILWATWVESGIVAMKQASDLGLTNIRSFGAEGMRDVAFFADAKAAEYLLQTKMMGTSPSAPSETLSSKRFVDDYKREFGEEPGLFGDTTYDATMVAALAVARAGLYDGPKIASQIKPAAYHYVGPSGHKLMDQYGDAVLATYDIWRVAKPAAEYVIESIGSWDSTVGLKLG